MASFSYKAKDPRGQVKTGTLNAKTKAQARQQLQRMRLQPLSVTAQSLDDPNGTEKFLGGLVTRDKNGNFNVRLGSSAPSMKDLVIFTKQFAVMIASGVPLVQALDVLAKQQRVPAFGEDLDRIRASIENGAKFSEALEAYPKTFDSLYVSMVRAGEQSGNLDTILLKLVGYIEKASKIKSQVKSAMMYPTVVIVVAVGVVSGLLAFVVPTFAKQFSDTGRPLPALTQMVLDLSDALVNHWYLFVGGAIAAFIAFKAWVQTEKGRVIWDGVLLKSPGLGNLLRKVAVGRFCSTMSTMLSSGVNMLEALTICATASGNKVIEAFVIGVRGAVEQGAKLSDPLGDKGIFPPMVVSMVAVGEKTGALDDMLMKVAEFYEDEVDVAVKGVLSMIEPILIVGIGGIVGTVVVAMYLPVFEMANFG